MGGVLSYSSVHLLSSVTKTTHEWALFWEQTSLPVSPCLHSFPRGEAQEVPRHEEGGLGYALLGVREQG